MNENLKKKLIEYTAENAFVQACAIEVCELEEDHAVMGTATRPELLNPMGMLHGGLLFTLAHCCSGVTARTDGRTYVTQTGIISIYYIAALKNVPSTYYEAAKIDGASSWQQFKSITLPLLTPTTFYLIVTGMIGSLQTFLEVNLFAPDGGRGYGVGSIVF